MKAEPDGYTILANSSAHTVAPWIVPNLPYDTAQDLSAVVSLGRNANVLLVNPGKGWKTAQDLVAAAKKNPGSITYGSAGVGTATHISAERFRQSATRGDPCPLQGWSEALPTCSAAASISTIVRSRPRSRWCATAACSRSPVSTPARAAALAGGADLVEAGYPDSDYTVWYGVFRPAKTPRPIVETFYNETTKVLATRRCASGRQARGRSVPDEARRDGQVRRRRDRRQRQGVSSPPRRSDDMVRPGLTAPPQKKR